VLLQFGSTYRTNSDHVWSRGGVIPVVKYCVEPLNVHPVALAHVGATPGAASYVPGLAKLTYDAASDAAPMG